MVGRPAMPAREGRGKRPVRCEPLNTIINPEFAFILQLLYSMEALYL